MRNEIDRVKQFLPFDSLKGFKDALLAVETKGEDKIELSDNLLDNLDKKVKSLNIGVKVTIKYYYGIEYVETTGIVKKIDNTYKCIYLLNTKINFDDIIDIEVI